MTADEELRYLLRKRWNEARTPPDYKLLGISKVLVLIGWAVVFGLLLSRGSR